MADYPILDEPLEPGLITLYEFGREIGRSPDTIRCFWRTVEGFPAPVGQLRSRGRNGGGRGRLVYSRDELIAFRTDHPKLWPEMNNPRIAVDRDPDERVTLGHFADRVAQVARKTVTQARDSAGFPAPDEDGLFRLGDLIDWWNTRPGRGLRRKEQAAA